MLISIVLVMLLAILMPILIIIKYYSLIYSLFYYKNICKTMIRCVIYFLSITSDGYKKFIIKTYVSWKENIEFILFKYSIHF